MCNLKRADGNLCNTSSLQKEMRAWGCWGSGKLLKIWWRGKEARPDRLPCKYVSQKERLIWGLSSSWHRVRLCTFPLQILWVYKRKACQSHCWICSFSQNQLQIYWVYLGVLYFCLLWSYLRVMDLDPQWLSVVEKRIGRQSLVYAVIKKLPSVGQGICL